MRKKTRGKSAIEEAETLMALCDGDIVQVQQRLKDINIFTIHSDNDPSQPKKGLYIFKKLTFPLDAKITWILRQHKNFADFVTNGEDNPYYAP